MPETIAITRDVSDAFAQCELTHQPREPIDVGRARAQHRAYCACLASLGCRVERLPADPALPDCVFVEDVALVFDEIAVMTRPGAASRRAEATAVGHALTAFRALHHIAPPDTLDGGDVLRLGRQVVVGLSTRTTAGAAAQLAALLAPFGYEVRTLTVSGCLHLKTAVTQVAGEALLLNPAWVDAAAFAGYRCLAVDPSEPTAANALLVGDAVIHPLAFPHTRARLQHAGIRVLTVDVSEMAKAEGGVTCCSLLFTAG